MELKILALALFAGILFLSGCTQGPSEEQQAIELADVSAFGKIMEWYNGLLERGKDCDFDEFVSIMEEQGGTIEEEEALKPYFDSARQCLPVLEKKAEKIEESKYRVIFSFKPASTCKDEELVEEMKKTSQMGDLSNQSVVVDLKTREVEMPEMPSQGGISQVDSWDDYYKLLETQMKQAEAIYEEDAETAMDCSLVGGFAIYQYVKEYTPTQKMYT